MIVVFTALCALLSSGAVSMISVVEVPVPIVEGLGVGILFGIVMNRIFQSFSFAGMNQFQ